MSVLLIPIVWIIDQWTKKYAQDNLRDSKRRYYANKKISLGYVENRGAFLGALKDKPKLLHGFTIGSLIIILLLGLPYWFSDKGRITGIGLALMLGGAIGNYTDRVKDGYVTDFVAFGPKHKVHFNIADFAIFKGVLLILIGEIIGD